MTPPSSLRRRPGRPSLDRSELIEDELLDGALREFVREGYGGASINRIVQALGISKTTFYSRFASKRDLLQAIVTRQIDSLQPDGLFARDDGKLELAMGLRAYANRMLEASLHGDILAINRLIYSESQRFPELGAASAARSKIGVKQVAEFIAFCADRDKVPVRDPTSVAQAFIFMLRGWYVDVMLTDRTVSLFEREKWVDQAVRTLVSARSDW